MKFHANLIDAHYYWHSNIAKIWTNTIEIVHIWPGYARMTLWIRRHSKIIMRALLRRGQIVYHYTFNNQEDILLSITPAANQQCAEHLGHSHLVQPSDFVKGHHFNDRWLFELEDKQWRPFTRSTSLTGKLLMLLRNVLFLFLLLELLQLRHERSSFLEVVVLRAHLLRSNENASHSDDVHSYSETQTNELTQKTTQIISLTKLRWYRNWEPHQWPSQSKYLRVLSFANK